LLQKHRKFEDTEIIKFLSFFNPVKKKSERIYDITSLYVVVLEIFFFKMASIFLYDGAISSSSPITIFDGVSW